MKKPKPLYLIGWEGIDWFDNRRSGKIEPVVFVSGGYRATIPFEYLEHARRCKGKDKDVKIFKLVEVK
jgi:hypothetical protein